MFEELTAEADRLLAEALDASGERDPRDYYRSRLKELRVSNPEGYDAAIEYYQNKLIPPIASGEVEPLIAWMEYGKFLAESFTPGQTVSINQSGESHPYDPTTTSGKLVLHIPESGKGGRAILVGLPSELSPANERPMMYWYLENIGCQVEPQHGSRIFYKVSDSPSTYT